MGSGVGKPTAVEQTTQSTATSTTTRSNSVQSTARTTRSNSTQHQHQAPSTSATANQTLPQGLNPTTSSQLQDTDDAEMVCEACSANFTIFKRKHRCLDCEKYFCSNCIHKEPRKCCLTCRRFEGLATRGDVMQVKLKDLRTFLQLRNISIETCKEKGDLVDLVTQHLGLSVAAPHILPQGSSTNSPRVRSEPPRQSSVTSSSTDDTIPITEPNTSTTARPTRIGGNEETTGQPSVHIYGETPLGPMRHAWNEDSSSPEAQSEASPDMDEFPEIINIPNQGTNTQSQASDGANGSSSQAAKSTDGPSRKQRASVSDIKDVLDIESLTVKQMKEILARNFVDYKGCVERYELEERVRRLFNEKQEFKQREEKAAALIKDAKNAEDIYDLDPDVCCKICMDAPIDCVLLECGHMVTCSKCGKRLAECPICRQYVVRAVHVFKS